MISLGINGLGIANKAGSRPSLNLDFINSQIFDPRITFTRASTATRVNASGLIEVVASDSPRIDYDPVTLAPKGLLIEEQRTNLILMSEAVATSPWFNSGLTSITNNTTDVTSPAGDNTATKLVTTGTSSAFGQPLVLTANNYTGSIWLRSSSGNISTQLIIYLGTSPFTNIGTQSITITTTWQRFTVKSTTATAASYNLQVNGIGAGTVYAWGAQLEAGSFATSYIPTTSAQTTRVSDNAAMTGTNFSSWYNQTEGAFLVNAYSPADRATSGSFRSLLQAVKYATFNSDSLFFMKNSVGQGSFTVRSNFTTDVALTSPVYGLTTIKAAGSYALNNFNYCANGYDVYTDTLGNIPVNVDRLILGAVGDNNVLGNLNGHISKLSYYPKRLTNSELQALTTG